MEYKKLCSTLAVIFFIFSMTIVYAYKGFGICSYGKEKLNSIVCSGPTVLNATIVLNDLKVVGSLDANKASAGNVTIEGSAYMKDSTIRGPLNVDGKLTAYGGNFQNNIFISADQVLLSHSMVAGSIVITSKSTKPTITIQCDSQINGSVVFNGTKGWVQITDDSMIRGRIINATMEFIRVKCK
jgi:hypothetical protein